MSQVSNLVARLASRITQLSNSNSLGDCVPPSSTQLIASILEQIDRRYLARCYPRFCTNSNNLVICSVAQFQSFYIWVRWNLWSLIMNKPYLRTIWFRKDVRWAITKKHALFLKYMRLNCHLAYSCFVQETNGTVNLKTSRKIEYENRDAKKNKEVLLAHIRSFTHISVHSSIIGLTPDSLITISLQ